MYDALLVKAIYFTLPTGPSFLNKFDNRRLIHTYLITHVLLMAHRTTLTCGDAK